jgi:hypothetical protein
MKRRNTWDPTASAFCGAMAGMTLTLVLESYDVFAGWFDGTDPYIHIATEMAVFAAGGALLFVALARRRHRASRKRRPND